MTAINEFLHDRGRGPELIGTRITVYNLVPFFLETWPTEEHIAKSYGLTAEQVAAARAYVLNNFAEVMARHNEIEAEIARGNPPEVLETAKRVRADMQRFREWLAERNRTAPAGTQHPPALQAWLAECNSQPATER